VQALGEPERGTDEGKPEGRALPAGARLEGEDPALGEGVPPLQRIFEPTSDLDMLAALDEPERLAYELERIAKKKNNSPRRQQWMVLAAYAQDAREKLEKLNEPAAR
jgi:hypothetical protein